MSGTRRLPSSSPLHIVRFFHETIKQEAQILEYFAHSKIEGTQLREVAARLPKLRELYDLHSEAEEQFLFDRLEKAAPGLRDPYLYDHQEEIEIFSGLSHLMVEMARHPGAISAEQASRLKRDTVVLTETLALHCQKEEDLVLPKLQSLLDAGEALTLAKAFVEIIPEKRRPELIPLMIKTLSLGDQVEFISILRLWPELGVGPRLHLWLKDELTAKAWKALVERVPALGLQP